MACSIHWPVGIRSMFWRLVDSETENKYAQEQNEKRWHSGCILENRDLIHKDTRKKYERLKPSRKFGSLARDDFVRGRCLSGPYTLNEADRVLRPPLSCAGASRRCSNTAFSPQPTSRQWRRGSTGGELRRRRNQRHAFLRHGVDELRRQSLVLDVGLASVSASVTR
jgi:hypothetical protein